MSIDPNNPYTQMQRREMAAEAAKWTPENRNPVVGAWDQHETWADYDLLFAGLDTQNMVALDFGCGPGRMIVRYASRFRQIDGADLDETNIKNARMALAKRGKTFMQFHKTNGVDLGLAQSDYYDLVFSCITLQHIPVHSIRLNLFREFFRVLKPGGWLTAQMGFGETDDYRGVDYYADKWDAPLTNGGMDVKVTSEAQIHGTLLGAGFLNTSFTIRPTGPNDWHPNWIFFGAQKPEVK